MSPEDRELGLGLLTDKLPGGYAPLARIAEDAGFDVVTVFNDLWFQPALPALLEIAAATKRLRLGPGCLSPYTVHPVEIAGQIAALDLAADGRAFLGLAAGAWLDALGVEQRRPLTNDRRNVGDRLPTPCAAIAAASRERCSGSSPEAVLPTRRDVRVCRS